MAFTARGGLTAASSWASVLGTVGAGATDAASVTVAAATDTAVAVMADTAAAVMQDVELTAERLAAVTLAEQHAVMRVAELEAQHQRHAADSAVAAEPVVASAAVAAGLVVAVAATAVAAADTGN